MQINKANFSTTEDSIEVNLPIVKIDKQKRTISGFATLDNVDNEGDEISAEASSKAFARWRGNIREMHQPIAVGKAVDIRQEDFYDPETDRTYRGMFVTARISKGAQSTWEKILDGTLTGFSIGGKILEKSERLDKTSGNKVRVITDYDLLELSVVDSPCNKLANLVSIEKSDDGLIFKGASVIKAQTVFYCEKDGVATASTDTARECLECGDKMQDIGWIEENDNKADALRAVVQEYKISKASATVDAEPQAGTDQPVTLGGEEIAAIAAQVQQLLENNGGGNVATEEETAVAVEEAAVEEEPKAADVDEVVTEEEPTAEVTVKFDERFEEFGSQLEKTLDAVSKTSEAVEKLSGSVGEVNEKVSEVEKSFSEKLEALDNRLKAVEEGGAVRKSEEVTKVVDAEDEDDNIWRGRILDPNALRKI